MNDKTENPRHSAINYLRTTIPVSEWDNNKRFIQQLKDKIQAHQITNHPMIEILNSGLLDKEGMITVQLEYRHAIVQIFTDALLMAQHLTKQLEPRLVAGSKMHARFLITLNILDEFGFKPGLSEQNYYLGDAMNSHYLLFEKLLDDYGVSQLQRNNFQPTPIATQVKEYLENTYDDLSSLCALLAVAEEEVILFSPPLRQNTNALGVDVSSGYYYVHGTSGDISADAADDEHVNDLWWILNQALTPDIYDNIESRCLEYCDLWYDFWDKQMELSYVEKERLIKTQA